MHCVHCSMPKGTFWAEAMLNSEKLSLYSVLLIVIESDRQLVSK